MAIPQGINTDAQQTNGGVLQSVKGGVGNVYEHTSSFVTRKATEAAHAGGDAAQYVADQLKAPEPVPGPAEQKGMDMGAEAGRKIDSANAAAAENLESTRDTVASSDAVQHAAAAKNSAAAKASETKLTMAEKLSHAKDTVAEQVTEARHQAAEASRGMAAKLDTTDEKQQQAMRT
uniref:Uncharacterized protein n=1 Tax=Chrysotila carterae TaxID=13221 RepID=A0A7S4C6D8_CHRCT